MCPGAGGGGQCLPWAGNGKSFSSFSFRPRKAQGGSWLRAREVPLGPGGGLETIPLSGRPPKLGARRSPVIIHLFPTPLLEVFIQALTNPRTPQRAPVTPCLTRPEL